MTRSLKISFAILALMSLIGVADAQESGLLVRIAEVEIDSRYLEEYMAILNEEAEASVRLEPGVISIFPMFQRENPTQVRILEIYTSREAYEAHLKTPHFQKYKKTTLEMVKSLKLVGHAGGGCADDGRDIQEGKGQPIGMPNKRIHATCEDARA